MTSTLVRLTFAVVAVLHCVAAGAADTKPPTEVTYTVKKVPKAGTKRMADIRPTAKAVLKAEPKAEGPGNAAAFSKFQNALLKALAGPRPSGGRTLFSYGIGCIGCNNADAKEYTYTFVPAKGIYQKFAQAFESLGEKHMTLAFSEFTPDDGSDCGTKLECVQNYLCPELKSCAKSPDECQPCVPMPR